MIYDYPYSYMRFIKDIKGSDGRYIPKRSQKIKNKRLRAKKKKKERR